MKDNRSLHQNKTLFVLIKMKTLFFNLIKIVTRICKDNISAVSIISHFMFFASNFL